MFQLRLALLLILAIVAATLLVDSGFKASPSAMDSDAPPPAKTVDLSPHGELPGSASSASEQAPKQQWPRRAVQRVEGGFEVEEPTETPDGAEVVLRSAFGGVAREEVVVFPRYLLDELTNETRGDAGKPLPIHFRAGVEELVAPAQKLREERDREVFPPTPNGSAAAGADVPTPTTEVMENEELGSKWKFTNDLGKSDALFDEFPDRLAKKLTPRKITEYRHSYGRCEGSVIRLTNVTSHPLVAHRLASRQYRKFPDTRLDSTFEVERCQSIMVRMLFIFSAAMEEMGLTGQWFLTHGSLLGAVRHGGFIPWDSDIDIAISKRAYTKIEKMWNTVFPRDMFHQTYHTDAEYRLQLGNKVNGFVEQTRLMDRYSTYNNYPFPLKGKNKRYYHIGPQLDLIPIYTHKQTKERILISTAVNASTLFPVKYMCFEGVLMPIPNEWRELLDTLYPRGWQTLQDAKGIHHNFYNFHNCRASQPSRRGGNKWWLSMKEDAELLAKWEALVAKLRKGDGKETELGEAQNRLVQDDSNPFWTRNDPKNCRFDRKRGKLVCRPNPAWVAPGNLNQSTPSPSKGEAAHQDILS